MTEVTVQVISTTIVCRFYLKCLCPVRVSDCIWSVLEAEGLLMLHDAGFSRSKVRGENVFSVWFCSPTEETYDFKNKQQQSG